MLQDVVLAKPDMHFPALDMEASKAAPDTRDDSNAGIEEPPQLQRTSLYDSVTSAEHKSPYQRASMELSASKR